MIVANNYAKELAPLLGQLMKKKDSKMKNQEMVESIAFCIISLALQVIAGSTRTLDKTIVDYNKICNKGTNSIDMLVLQSIKRELYDTFTYQKYVKDTAEDAFFSKKWMFVMHEIYGENIVVLAET